MATEAQIQANRLNAQKSTGPCTPEGKEKVSQNAVKHGLLGQVAALLGQERQEYTRYREQMLADLGPAGNQETDLAERIVRLSWRLRRTGEYQNTVFEALCERHAAEVAEESAEADAPPLPDGNRLLGQMLLADFSGPRVLERLQLYERRFENALYRARAELRQLRSDPLRSIRAAVRDPEKRQAVNKQSQFSPPSRSMPTETAKITAGGITAPAGLAAGGAGFLNKQTQFSRRTDVRNPADVNKTNGKGLPGGDILMNKQSQFELPACDVLRLMPRIKLAGIPGSVRR